MYKLSKNIRGEVNAANYLIGSVMYSIPFDPANTDYANFKSQINADEAELQDADGVLMSPEEAKAFVATLP